MMIGRTLAPPRINCATNDVGTTPSPTISAGGGDIGADAGVCCCDTASTDSVTALTDAVAASTADCSAKTRITTLEEIGVSPAGHVCEPHWHARRKLPAAMAPTASERRSPMA